MLVHHDSRPSVHRGIARKAAPERGWKRLARLVTFLSVCQVLGCGNSEETSLGTPPGTSDGDRTSVTVVSLSPAITTTLIDLGQADRLVGRTPWCRGIDDCAVAGTLEGVDAEVLVALQPAVVLHQPPATGSDPVLLDLQRRLGFSLGGGRLDGVDDVLELLEQIEDLGLASSDRIDERRRALTAIGDRATGESDPIAVLLHSVDPVGVAGENTYLGELARAAGLRNAAGPGGWREWSVEMLVTAEPDLVVVFTSDGMEDRVRERLSLIEWHRPPAIAIVSNPDAFEPSTRMPRVLEDLRHHIGQAGIASSGAEGEVDGDD